MRKLILILLIVTSPVFALIAQQDSTVNLSKEIAIWYLGRHYTASYLEVETVRQDSVIVVWKGISKLRQIQIDSYKTDSVTYAGIASTYQTEISIWKKSEAIYKKKVKVLRRQRNWVVVGAVVIITLVAIQ